MEEASASSFNYYCLRKLYSKIRKCSQLFAYKSAVILLRGKKIIPPKLKGVKNMIQTDCARMLMRVKVSPHVEVVSLLQRMSNTRERTITLDVEMEDYPCGL